MSYTPTKIPLKSAVGPHLGLFVGGAISWILAYLAGLDASSLASLLSRSIAIVTSLLFWSFFSAAWQNKEIYGGGLVDLESSRKDRLRNVIIFLGFLWFVGVVFFVTKNFAISGLVIMIVFCLFIYELFVGDIEKMYGYGKKK